MRYKLTEGVVLTKVCGEHILIATKSAWDKCPYTKMISPLRAAFWKGLSEGLSDAEMIDKLKNTTRIKEEALWKQFEIFSKTAMEDGYMTAEE